MPLVKRLLKPVLFSLIVLLFGTGFVVAEEIDDASLFVEAFDAYLKKDYLLTIEKIKIMRQFFPDSPIQDVTLLLLARAGLKSGDYELAAKSVNLFNKEHASSPLKATIEDELLALANRKLRGENIPPNRLLLATAQAMREENNYALGQPVAPVVVQERAAEIIADSERTARNKADAERKEKERLAQEAADRARIAKEKADAEQKEQEQIARRKADAERKEKERLLHEAAEKLRLAREKADAERKELERIAAEKIARESTRIAVNIIRNNQVVEAGANSLINFEVANQGKSDEDFVLQVVAPAEYAATLVTKDKKHETSSRVTIETGVPYKGIATYRIPGDTVDGYKGTITLRAASARFSDIGNSMDAHFSVAAPLLRVVARPLHQTVQPGEKTRFRITLLNAGSLSARALTVRVNLPPQTEFLDAPGLMYWQEPPSVVTFAVNSLDTGKLLELGIDVKVREDCSTGQELRSRIEVVNAHQKTRETYTSAAIVVEAP